MKFLAFFFFKILHARRCKINVTNKGNVEQNQLDNDNIYFVFFLSNVMNLSNIRAGVGKAHCG
jgi:hypothetical protein